MLIFNSLCNLLYNRVVQRFDSKCILNRHCLFSSNSAQMPKILNVAEKNDAAKHIAAILSNGTSQLRNGLCVYNKIYEFNYNILGRDSRMVMTSVSGHLLNDEFLPQYKSWQSFDPVALFDAPLQRVCDSETAQQIKSTLEREVQGADALIIWTDCDREGENIGFEIIDVCKKKKPNLDVWRAKFSEITAAAIHRACRNLIRPDALQDAAVNVRRELDLRIGAAFTRLQTLRLQRAFPSLGRQLVSYGSCQFPTLGFVVERYRAIENFIPEDFQRIDVTHKKDGLEADFSWKRGRLFDFQAAFILYERCLESTTAKVTSVKSKPKSKWRPQPMDTICMEKLAVRKLRMSAKMAMQIAEKLYTQGFISYPRTETTKFPPELKLEPLVANQTGDSNWGEFANRVLEQGGPNPRNGTKSDQAHPPIHPLKYGDNLRGDEARLYELVVRHFLACVSKDAIGHETIVDIVINHEQFTLSGLQIVERNYLDVYPYEKWNAKEIPKYEQGEEFEPTSIMLYEGKTTAPPLLTEADLITLMEKHGIGTDATHADHIETVKQREYIGLCDATHFVPGKLGMGLVEGYDSMGLEISKPHLRATLEEDLKAICEGRKNADDVLRQQIAIYREVFSKSVEQLNKLQEAVSKNLEEQAQEAVVDGGDSNAALGVNPLVMKCPKCQTGSISLRKKRDGNRYETCVGGCDPNFMQTLGISRITSAPSVPSLSTASNRSATHGNSSNNSSNNTGARNNIQHHFTNGSHVTGRGAGTTSGRNFGAGNNMPRGAGNISRTPSTAVRRTSTSNSTGAPSRQRKCGLCGETGHNRKKCPRATSHA